MYVLGIDPGPLPGIVRLHLATTGDQWSGRSARLLDAQALQVTAGLVPEVLEAMHAFKETGALAYERFVVGPRAARSKTPQAGEATRNMIGRLQAWVDGTNIPVFARSAAEVKPWATDERLDAAGLLETTRGMRHARDAARHALFCAVKNFGLADPLSKKAGAR